MKLKRELYHSIWTKNKIPNTSMTKITVSAKFEPQSQILDAQSLPAQPTLPHVLNLGGSRNWRHPRGTPRLSILPTITNERLDTTILINPQERCSIGRNRRISIVLKVAVARSENATDDCLSRDFVGPHGDRVLGPVFW
jgi:hypothetical protein